MARAEFETFAKSLVMNYRRVAAKAEPPRARCLEVAKVEPGSLADRILLSPNDLLVSINGQSAATMAPQLWKQSARLREYIFYSPSSRERIELTAPAVEPGLELRRTPEMIRAVYKPETRDPEPLLELWHAGSWEALASLSAAVLRASTPTHPAQALYGAALCETGQVEAGRQAIARYLHDGVRHWTVDYRGLCFYYVGLQRAEVGETAGAIEVLGAAFADLPSDRIADALVNLGQPRPTPAVLWTGRTAPTDYELRTLEGTPKTVTMSEALLELGEGEIFLLCLIGSYRGNGPYNDFMQRYRAYARDFKPFIRMLHVVTEVKDRYPDRPYYFEAEDKARAEKLPFELLHDPEITVRSEYQPHVSPFTMAINREGLILAEGDFEGPVLWRALVAANA